MLLYALKRLLYVLPVAFGVSIVCFMLVHLAPGDPLTAIMPIDATAEQQAQMHAAYGFDKPLPVQYGIWLFNVLHGDLGASIASGRPVAIEVPRLPCRTCQNQSAYCTGSGLSKPYSARIWSISSWVASAGRIADSGSPGAMWTRRKQMMLTPITTGVT